MINPDDMKEFERQFKDFKIEEMPTPNFEGDMESSPDAGDMTNVQQEMAALMAEILATLTSIDEYIRQ